MRFIPVAVVALALALGSGAALAECGAHQAKSGEVASSKPLVDRLAALSPTLAGKLKTQ